MASYDFSLLAVTVPVVTIAGIAGAIGLFVGSFLNVVIYRTPLGLSVSSPRSFCPRCRRQLAWWENVPVVSWALLKGRCRTCHNPISIRYPAIELTTGIAFGLVTWGWHGTAVSAGYCCLAAAMIAVGLIEYGGKRSPLAVAAFGTGLGQLLIIAAAAWEGHGWIAYGSLIGTSVAFAIFAFLRVADPECTDPRGHGRSALLVSGCWLGGLRLEPVAIGVAVWIVTYFVCMVATWTKTRHGSEGREGGTSVPVQPVIGTPLVTALAMAMAVSLVIRGH